MQASAFWLPRGSPHHATFPLTQWESGAMGTAPQESKRRCLYTCWYRFLVIQDGPFNIWNLYRLYKKNVCIFFQKYGFIRKIEPFKLRTKHNIIQMTATAGLTYSIKPIFQYIFDCLGIRSISKTVAFGAQEIQTSSLRCRCTIWTTFGCNRTGRLATQPT